MIPVKWVTEKTHTSKAHLFIFEIKRMLASFRSNR